MNSVWQGFPLQIFGIYKIVSGFLKIIQCSFLDKRVWIWSVNITVKQ
jgi:hypothetical protein